MEKFNEKINKEFSLVWTIQAHHEYPFDAFINMLTCLNHFMSFMDLEFTDEAVRIRIMADSREAMFDVNLLYPTPKRWAKKVKICLCVDTFLNVLKQCTHHGDIVLKTNEFDRYVVIQHKPRDDDNEQLEFIVPECSLEEVVKDVIIFPMDQTCKWPVNCTVLRCCFGKLNELCGGDEREKNLTIKSLNSGTSYLLIIDGIECVIDENGFMIVRREKDGYVKRAKYGHLFEDFSLVEDNQSWEFLWSSIAAVCMNIPNRFGIMYVTFPTPEYPMILQYNFVGQNFTCYLAPVG